MTALAKIKQAGFALALLPDGNLYIEPASQLKPEQQQWLKIHKAEIIAELKQSATIPPMEQWQRAAVSAWVKSLGGSDAEIQEETLETIQQCETSMEARLYFLKRATELLPKHEPPKPVKCGDCRHFKRYEGYGNSTAGECLQKVMPLGMVHYGDTPKRCGKFEA